MKTLTPSEQTIEDMSKFLSKDSRLRLLDDLFKQYRKRPRENFSQKTGISKPHTYRYFPKNGKNKRLVPNSKTTGKIIKQLLHEGAISSVLAELDEVELRLRRVTKEYHNWKNEMIKNKLIY